MKFLVPAIWLAIAIGVYVYNQQGQGQVVMWGVELLVGDDPKDRGNATVGLALFIAALTAVGPVASLFRRPPVEEEE